MKSNIKFLTKLFVNFVLTILSIFIYLIFIPLGLMMRLLGRDKLNLAQPKNISLWKSKKRPTDLNQFLKGRTE